MGSRSQCASLLLLVVFVLWLDLSLCLDHDHQCGLSAVHDHNHDCAHDHRHDHHHHHHHHHDSSAKLPEELAEEEDLKLYGFGYHHDHDHDHDHDHHHHQGDQHLSGLGLWAHALGCSFLVSMASLICLIILPLIFVQGKLSKGVVDSLALFGAGAMLGDAFLHQLPHAFGGEHSHSHDHHVDDLHSLHEHGHGHSLEDLSVGISILAGIVLFLLVEKLVRYVEQHAGESNAYHHGHHHHCPNKKKLEDDKPLSNERENLGSKIQSEEMRDKDQNNPVEAKHLGQEDSHPRKRKVTTHATDPSQNQDSIDALSNNIKSVKEAESSPNLVFGYLNLFSDGVHNFTDGMALGSAFLLYGSVGGWSRTLFLLAHELPQEIGDFGILVRSGFSVSKALFFNFLSALMALGGTATALLWGQDPGQSSLIEGFTAGGFIYIAVAGVLAEMNNGSLALKSSIVQLISLILGMGVALCISLVE